MLVIPSKQAAALGHTLILSIYLSWALLILLWRSVDTYWCDDFTSLLYFHLHLFLHVLMPRVRLVAFCTFLISYASSTIYLFIPSFDLLHIFCWETSGFHSLTLCTTIWHSKALQSFLFFFFFFGFAGWSVTFGIDTWRRTNISMYFFLFFSFLLFLTY